MKHGREEKGRGDFAAALGVIAVLSAVLGATLALVDDIPSAEGRIVEEER